MDAYTRLSHSGAAQPMQLGADLTATGLTITLSEDPGPTWPDGSDGPFIVTVDRGNVEERILVASRSAAVLTVSALSNRGVDGTSATSHVAGNVVEHTHSGVEADEANNAAVQTVGQISAKGQLLVGHASRDLDVLGAGTNGQVLQADDSTATGLKYGPVPGHTHDVEDPGAVGIPLHNHEDNDAGGLIPLSSLDGVGVEYTPAWTSGGTAPAKGNGTLTGRYFKIGKLVFVDIKFVVGTTTNKGTGTYAFSLPFTAATSDADGPDWGGMAEFFSATSVPNLMLGGARVQSGESTCILFFAGPSLESGFADFDTWTSTSVPAEDMAPGDIYRVHLRYEAA